VIEKISTLEVRQRLGDILNRVALRNDQFIIERKGKPLAAVVPVERGECPGSGITLRFC
jgi:prevent-host-death family protein